MVGKMFIEIRVQLTDIVEADAKEVTEEGRTRNAGVSVFVVMDLTNRMWCVLRLREEGGEECRCLGSVWHR